MKALRALGKGSVASFLQIGLEIAWWLLWIAAVGLAVGVLGYALTLTLVATGAIDPAILTGGRGSIELGEASGHFDVAFDDQRNLTWPYIVPALLAGGVAIGGGLVIVSRLKSLFGNFASNQPFSADNAGHVRVIWIALLVMENSRYAIAALMKGLVLALGQPQDVNVIVAPSLSLSAWAAILILIVLAEVFREGARLREDQELTI